MTRRQVVLGGGALIGLAGLAAAAWIFLQARQTLAVLTCANCPAVTAAAPLAEPIPVAGFGILGDSNSDEYCGSDHRGGEYAAHTLNWVEQLAWRRGLNFGAWGEWNEPRRLGYEFNWSRSAATAASLISSGQHLGLAEQVARGQVSHVFVWIGTNDFTSHSGSYGEIYAGRLAGFGLQAKLETLVADITTAVDTVQQAGPVALVVVTVPDEGIAPDTILHFPDPAGRQRVTDAVDTVNRGLAALAAQRGLALVDVNAFGRSVLPRLNLDGALLVEQEAIQVFGRGDEPHFGRLGDPAGHAGTVLAGLTGNVLFVETFNRAFGLEIQPLTDVELLENAGLRPLPPEAPAAGNPCAAPTP